MSRHSTVSGRCFIQELPPYLDYSVVWRVGRRSVLDTITVERDCCLRRQARLRLRAPCRVRGLCSWDTDTKQWNALGGGIIGEVSSVAYAGSDYQTVFVGGRPHYSRYRCPRQCRRLHHWQQGRGQQLGDGHNIPGPVTALEVNNRQRKQRLRRGQVFEQLFAFLHPFRWRAVAADHVTLDDDSTVASMAMVPLTDTHAEKRCH